MFERFDERGRRVVVLAQEQARLLDHGYIGTEHLLLGILALDGPLADALGERGASLEAVRYQVEEIVGPVPGPPSGYIPFTPRAKEVLELSLREALRLGHQPIGPGHVLLGLLREGKGIACQALLVLGVDLGQLRAIAEEVAGELVASEGVPAPPTLDLDGLRAVLRAVEAAFGADVRLREVRLRGPGVAQVVVEMRDRRAVEVVRVVDRGDRWEVDRRP